MDSSLYFGSPGRTGAREIYGSEIFPAAVTEAMSPTTGQKDVTAKWKEYGRTGFPKYVAGLQKGAKNEAKGWVTVRSLEPFSEQAVDERIASLMEDVGS